MVAAKTAPAESETDKEYGPRVRHQEDDRLLTKAELTRKLSLSNPRYVEALVQKRRIPFVRLGYRTLRFDWRRVRAALEKLTVNEVGSR